VKCAFQLVTLIVLWRIKTAVARGIMRKQLFIYSDFSAGEALWQVRGWPTPCLTPERAAQLSSKVRGGW
jgi:hypothetical protein